jgi:hypothetical protein
MRVNIKLNEWHLKKGQDFFGPNSKLIKGIFLSKGNETIMVEEEDVENAIFDICCNLWEKWKENEN